MATKTNEAELQFREQLASRLAAIEVGQQAMSQKIDDKIALLDARLQPLVELHATVKDHDRDIARWKGVNATLSLLLTLAAAAIGKIKHLF